MEPVTKEVRENWDQKSNDMIGNKVRSSVTSLTGNPSRSVPPTREDDTLIGFDQEVKMIKDQLTGLSKQLDVISIVGMAGLGKTTLAKRLYNDPFIVYHFYIRGWTYVSQVFKKGDLLQQILSSFIQHKSDIQATSDEKLGENLYRRLKGKRYLIVIDDIWDIAAWDIIKKSFPNDNNGSRILFTSRMKEVAFRAKPDKPPHFLRFLTDDESWLLLQRKVFLEGSPPQDLVEIGKQIAEKCHGLPLTIVVIAGLLAKTKKKQDWWKQVADSVSSYIVNDPEQSLNTVALSYNHLPQHLKPCFLYLGVFPEDYEIPVRKLIWLWVAEGFIKQIGQKSLEAIAEEYLLDLIDRSLVLVAKRKSSGGIRACRVHDVLRDVCLKKASEENFLVCDLFLEKGKVEHGLQQYSDSEEVSFLSTPIRNRHRCPCFHSCLFKLLSCMGLRKAKKKTDELELVSASSWIPRSSEQNRLCVHSRVFDNAYIKPFASHVHSFLCFSSKLSPSTSENLSCIYQEFKLLTVLDLSTIRIPAFPRKIVHLLPLRYLSLRGKYLSPPASIYKLCSLETLVISESTGIYIRPEIWKMLKLRHLCITGKNHVLKLPDDGYPSILENLQTISNVSPSQECQDVLLRTPHLRKLGFCGNLISNGRFWFPNIDFLNYLESLKLFNVTSPSWNGSYWDIRLQACCRNGIGCKIHPCRLDGIKFPQNLKRLTLSRTYLGWKEMSTIGMLPNLEALKLEFMACYGPLWDTSDGGFRQLKYLRFNCMDIEEWNATESHFPSLQHLVLRGCEKLAEIPSELGDIHTLQRIDVSWCSRSTVVSARIIQAEQQSKGNEWLQTYFNPPLSDFTEDS